MDFGQGAAILASWLHLLCFIGTVGLDKKTGASTEENQVDPGSITSSKSNIDQSSSSMLSSKDITKSNSSYDSKNFVGSEQDFNNNTLILSRRPRLVRFAEEENQVVDARSNHSSIGLLMAVTAARIRSAFGNN